LEPHAVAREPVRESKWEREGDERTGLVADDAEANAIIRADFDLMDDASLYIFGMQQGKPRTGMPCFMCWRMIFNAGIGKVSFGKFLFCQMDPYPSTLPLTFLKPAVSINRRGYHP
jgi:deoxycytidylate deaminase